MKAAETPDRAPSTALFVHKVLLNQSRIVTRIKESNQEPFKILVSILVNLDETIVPSEIIPSKIKMLKGNRFNELLK